ncbi:PfkB family carbohydrate kinase, partial [Streptococcus suis]
GGSEINVACNLQGFGCETKLLTALPQGSLGDRFLDFLDGKGIDTYSVQRKGERVGVYYMEAGFGFRSSQV